MGGGIPLVDELLDLGGQIREVGKVRVAQARAPEDAEGLLTEPISVHVLRILRAPHWCTSLVNRAVQATRPGGA
jgi:hypothetical protein